MNFTDPAKVDTDENGIYDADEDLDDDGLTNIEEYNLKTNPLNSDSDEDNLNDGEEVHNYGTDPLLKDTDNDGLDDDDEIYLNTDPLNPDTDGNGIKDGDEKFEQTFTYNNGDSVIKSVLIKVNATGNLQKTAEVENIMDKDILCSGVVGLVGEPFDISTSSQFDNAEISFEIDKSRLGDTEFEDLLFLWYDEENDNFQEMETAFNDNIVSIKTTHFSRYMIVNKNKW